MNNEARKNTRLENISRYTFLRRVILGNDFIRGKTGSQIKTKIA
jgi:hypothetical protein